MRRKLLEILCCPRCRQSLTIDAIEHEEDEDIVTGRLICSGCNERFAISDSIPRMVPSVAAVRRTKLAFEYEWIQRLSGRAEPRSIIFAQDVLAQALGWQRSAEKALQMSGDGSWCLDAGCGSADVTREFAGCVPSHDVVALDLSDTLSRSRREARHVRNLHFVQGDVFFPPFRAHSFAFVVSYGVLHHTADTARAFKAIAGTVQQDGTFLSWLYPLADEYPDSAFPQLYSQRDWHFLNLARYLPPWLGLLWCRLYAAALFPILIPRMQRISNFGTLSRRDSLSWKQLYRCAVFYIYDNVMPYYQHRHGRREVLSWYTQCQFGKVSAEQPGLFIGQRL